MLDLLPNYQLQSHVKTHFCSTSILQPYIRGSEICACCGITVVYSINYYLYYLFISYVLCCTATCFWMCCIHKVDWMSDCYCWSIVLLALRQLIIGHGCEDKSLSIGCSSLPAHPDRVLVFWRRKVLLSPVNRENRHAANYLHSHSRQWLLNQRGGETQENIFMHQFYSLLIEFPR